MMDHLRITTRAALILALAGCMAPGLATSVDAAGNTMEIMLSSSGVVATDPNGNHMFQAVSGPYFAHGLDSLFSQVYPLSSDLYLVPVRISKFALE